MMRRGTRVAPRSRASTGRSWVRDRLMTAPRRTPSPRPSGGGSRTPAGRASTRPGATVRRRPGADPSVEPVEESAAVTAPSRTRSGPRLTGRAAALLVVVGLLVVAYAWPAREYLRQRSELAQLRSDAAATQARVSQLEAERQRWQDPAYVEAQARDRLHFVLPGEVAYTVLRPGQTKERQTLPRSTPPATAWFDDLWGSVQGADDPGASPAAGAPGSSPAP